MTSQERPHVYICKKSAAGSYLIVGGPDKDLIEKGETRVATVEASDRQMTNDREPAIEKYMVERTKKAYSREATREAGMIDTNFQNYHNGLLNGTLKINDCVNKLVPISLRECFFLRSIIYRLLYVHLSNACKAQCHSISPFCTWRIVSISQKAALYVRVASKTLIKIWYGLSEDIVKAEKPFQFENFLWALKPFLWYPS